MGSHCQFPTNRIPDGYDIDLARMRIRQRFEFVRAGRYSLLYMQQCPMEQVGVKDSVCWRFEDHQQDLPPLDVWRAALLWDDQGESIDCICSAQRLAYFVWTRG
eukprot:1594436-Rhodomonas_salina.1